MDLLYPTQRYVDGLRETVITSASGDQVRNPLYVPSPLGAKRDRSLVFLAGIVGVPWQDLATDETRDDPTALEYLRAKDMDADRWGFLIGDPAQRDPFMVESVLPRSGTNSVANVSITSPDGPFNAINGHEQTPLPGREDDLQYACIFPLDPPRDCGPDGDAVSCDCFEEELIATRPLCHRETGEPIGTTQYYAKAYPGIRQLQVLRDFGDSSIAASICPKNVTGDAQNLYYGYNPAINAVVEGLKSALRPQCLPRKLPVDGDGEVPCTVVEAARPYCDCGLPGRAPSEAPNRAAALQELEQDGFCGDVIGIPCDEYCTCEITPTGDLCRNSVDAGAEVGFCYVDPDELIGNPALVEACDPSERQLVRFVGQDTPLAGAVTLLVCPDGL